MGENMFKMVTGIVLIMALDPQILFNHGYNDLFEVRFPKGSVIQPEFPAALSNRSHTLARIFDVLAGALAQQTPELATGAACGSSPHLLFSGQDEDDEFFLFYEINYGGIPGRPIGDGMDVHAWWPNVTSIPVEYAESYFPLRVVELRGQCDSGGAGRHRGGNGVYKEYEFLAGGDVSIHDDRAISRPWGIGGGLAAEGSSKVLVRRSGGEEELPSKLDFLRVEPGRPAPLHHCGRRRLGRSARARPKRCAARRPTRIRLERQGARRVWDIAERRRRHRRPRRDAPTAHQAERGATRSAAGVRLRAGGSSRGRRVSLPEPTSPLNALPDVASGRTPPPSVLLSDVTLREGEQAQGVVFRARDQG